MLRRFSCLLLAFYLLAAVQSLAQDSGRVSWIYDGDTLLVEGFGKVRLLGIDTPEYKDSNRDLFYQNQFGIAPLRLRQVARQAKEFNIRQVKGKLVRVETDLQQQDRHGRMLAYVYLPDGRLLNALLLEKGLASVYRRFDFRLKHEFLELESTAKKAHKGLWQD